ncbi:MAG: large subunit ribosomal protein L21, partial [Planctomycetota bacterium]
HGRPGESPGLCPQGRRAASPDRYDMYAVISDRNNQATVRVGDEILCDLMEEAERGSTITFDNVLLVGGDGDVKIGKPNVEGAKVTAEVLRMERGVKVVVFRFKRRKNIRVKRGHRQSYTRVRITDISG